MITLHGFGPAFGLPDPSPFCMKALVLLKMSGQPFETKPADLRKGAPKGKAPYMVDGDEVIPDSTFIRFHLEDKYGFDFDPGLSDEQKGAAWAFEKLCEDHLYFVVLNDRWMDDDNFSRGPANLFNSVPAMLRPIIRSQVRKSIKTALQGQGMGRHSNDEIAKLSLKALKSISDYLGVKPYLTGDTRCGADATVFAFVASALCTKFDSHTRTNAESFPNLKAYNDRCMAHWFPELAGKD